MPLRRSSHSEVASGEAPYFKSLADLDDYASTGSHAFTKRLTGVLRYTPRGKVQGVADDGRGQLLVCHDYKGGYTEKPSALAYTFNFWSLCSTFIYFSHHRVTIPPPGWINTAHRQGVKMLGTLIFEGDSEQDCLRLLVGRLPQSSTGPAVACQDNSFPVSKHYVRLLADLAVQRGFDGYLLNFECPLRGGTEQTQALCTWIAMLQNELRCKVGPHTEVIWYDSVVLTGHLRWQDRLNALNLPFFLPSTGFFTNYTWPPHYPSLTARYFLSLDRSLIEADSNVRPPTASKSLQSIFVGVDVWGRGSHGGGGLGCYRAICHIDPAFLGLSVALFGQAWTWESEQDKPGWSWDEWWAYERKLWVGPEKEGEVVEVPPEKEKQYPPGVPRPPEPVYGPFQPLSDFFARRPPPNPLDLPFYTSFSPGVGRSWFVQGNKVLQTENGWTDIDKQCSLGDMLWPRPTMFWEHVDLGLEVKLPEARAVVSMEDAWMGGSSLILEVTCAGSESEDAAFRCVWMPFQSLAITARKSYRATLVYKVDAVEGVDVDIGVSVKTLTENIEATFEVTPISSQQPLTNGWTQIDVEFMLTEERTQDKDISSYLGLVIGIASEDPSQDLKVPIYLGSLTIAPPQSPDNLRRMAKVLWADFERTQGPDNAPLSGTLTWEVAAAFPPVQSITITSPEDPQPAWIMNNAHSWIPSFLYFNIYVEAHKPDGTVVGPASSIFIGTSGLDGRARHFYVNHSILEGISQGQESSLRFYVQGVTVAGEVLPWEQCAFVNVNT